MVTRPNRACSNLTSALAVRCIFGCLRDRRRPFFSVTHTYIRSNAGFLTGIAQRVLYMFQVSCCEIPVDTAPGDCLVSCDDKRLVLRYCTVRHVLSNML